MRDSTSLSARAASLFILLDCAGCERGVFTDLLRGRRAFFFRAETDWLSVREHLGAREAELKRAPRLTKSARDALLKAQGGCCVVWGCTETRDLIEEHNTPSTWTGQRADQLMCELHHKIKTRDDIKKIAKVRRIQKGPRKAIRTIRSRGFDKTLSKKLSGEVIKRG